MSEPQLEQIQNEVRKNRQKIQKLSEEKDLKLDLDVDNDDEEENDEEEHDADRDIDELSREEFENLVDEFFDETDKAWTLKEALNQLSNREIEDLSSKRNKAIHSRLHSVVKPAATEEDTSMDLQRIGFTHSDIQGKHLYFRKSSQLENRLSDLK